MAAKQQSVVAPESANGPTQIMENGRQFYLDEDVAFSLVMLGCIEYSPEDGPNARVYRCVPPWTLKRIKTEVLGVSERKKALHAVR